MIHRKRMALFHAFLVPQPENVLVSSQGIVTDVTYVTTGAAKARQTYIHTPQLFGRPPAANWLGSPRYPTPPPG